MYKRRKSNPIYHQTWNEVGHLNVKNLWKNWKMKRLTIKAVSNKKWTIGLGTIFTITSILKTQKKKFLFFFSTEITWFSLNSEKVNFSMYQINGWYIMNLFKKQIEIFNCLCQKWLLDRGRNRVIIFVFTSSFNKMKLCFV